MADRSRGAEINDPIFYQDDAGVWRQVGYVSGRISDKSDERASGDGSTPKAPNLGDRGLGSGSGAQVQLTWYSHSVPIDECDLYQYRSSGSLEEVVTTMLPPEKRARIQERIASAMSQHGDDLSAAFVPLVQQSIKRSMPVIEEEFRVAVENHRAEIDALAERLNDEIVSDRLIPLAKREIMPIVRKHGQPPAEEIGREIWNRASLWRFGWRAVYDKTPLPQKGLVQEEWKRFVQNEAVPVIEAKMDDIVTAIQRILADVATNRAVRREMGKVADDLASDPAARALVRQILKETLVENERLRAVWSEVWSSEEASDAIDLAGDRLEPVVRLIGDDLFGNEETGIDPDFARVLRSQILRKDRRWIVAWHTGQPSRGEIKSASKRMPYPIVYMATQEQSAE
ncbi:hypothetical protein [Planctomycetes bacterium K23_9]|uniref:hypothetical protein n=1 Tax=Stieleria marina TaxID=1930275 RepID=UPI00119E0F22